MTGYCRNKYIHLESSVLKTSCVWCILLGVQFNPSRLSWLRAGGQGGGATKWWERWEATQQGRIVLCWVHQILILLVRAHRVRQVTALVCPRSDLSYILSAFSTRRYTSTLTPACIPYHLNHSSSARFPQSPDSLLISNNFCYQFNDTSLSLYDLLNSFNAYTFFTFLIFLLLPTW